MPPAPVHTGDRHESWAPWWDSLPKLVRTVLAEWTLTPDGAAVTGGGALVLPVLTGVGEPAVLKVGWPHVTSEHEHLALRAWAGDGAVRLLQADPRRSVLLLERADQDRDLASLPVLDACEVVTGLYRQLHRRAIPQLPTLSALAAGWAETLAGLRDERSVPRRYLDQAAGLARDFATDPASDGALIHGNLHYANVLAHDREPWSAIAPQPVSGEAAYEVAPLLWHRYDEVPPGSLRRALLDRLYAVVDVAQLDEERVRAWVVLRTVVSIEQSLSRRWVPPSPDWVTRAITILKAAQR